jgi:transposase
MTGPRATTTSSSSTVTGAGLRGRAVAGRAGGITRLHALIAARVPAGWADLDPAEAAGKVRVGIETDRGAWVAALVAAGYRVYAINPMSVARYRERHSTSGAKSDAGDAHVAPRSYASTTLITAWSPGTAPRPRPPSWWPAPIRR